MNRYPVQGIFLTELSGQIPLLRRNKDVLAGDEGWQEKNEYPGEIGCQSDPTQNANAAEIERIPR